MQKPQTSYTVYIAAPPPKIWAALTGADYTKQYFFGRRIEVDCVTGSPFILRMEDGRIDSQGKVLECDPPRLLTVSWRVEWLEEFRHLPETRVMFQIDPVGETSRLTVSEFHQEPVDDKILEGGRQGWAMILSGLKTLLETGKPLDLPTPEPPKEMVEAARRRRRR